MANTSLTDQDYYAPLGCFPALQMASAGFELNTTNEGTASSANLSSCNISGVNSYYDPDSSEWDALRDPINAMLVIILYVVVIFLGVVGNTLVVITVLKTKQLWNATNVFISNLAVADIFVCLFDLPVSLYYQITDDWIFGKALCHVIPAAFGVVVYASTLTLTLIAVDRFRLIVYPLTTRISVTMALILVVCVALVSTAVASPIAIFSEYKVFDWKEEAFNIHVHRRYCKEGWPNATQRHLYTVLTLVLQYFMPLVVIAILYGLIFRKIRLRMRQPNRRTKTTKVMVAVVLAFALTWTPFHLFSLISEFKSQAVKSRYYRLIDVLLRVLAMSSSCINPLLYGWLNDNYRNAFIGLIKKPTAPAAAVFREESRTSQKNLINSIRRASGLYKDTLFGKLRIGGRRGSNGKSKVAAEEQSMAGSPHSLEQRRLVVECETTPGQSPKITLVPLDQRTSIKNGGPSVDSPLLTSL